MRLHLQDFKKHGFTEGCKQCRYMETHGKAQGGLAHSDTCRARMMHELGKTVLGQQRLEQAEARINQALAKHVEIAAETAAPPAAPTPRLEQPQASEDVGPAEAQQAPQPGDIGADMEDGEADAELDEIFGEP